MKYPQVQIIIDILSRIDDSPKSKLGFDMSSTYRFPGSYHKCGSACCIGGWAQRAMDLIYGDYPESISNALSDLVNIPIEEAKAICFPLVDHSTVSFKVALRMLRQYRNTGKIDYIQAGAKTAR